MAEILGRLGQQALTPAGLLDILLVWGVVFWFLRLMRGSNSGHLKGLLLSLGLLGAAWLVTRPEHGLVPLPSFNWLLAKLAPLAALALVVVFAPEIRQSIGQLGQVQLFGRSWSGAPRSVVVHAVGEVADAARELAERRIGALLAIERRDPLAEIVETGKPVDAEVSAELLQTIFFPNTPLHDGAVVLRRDRLAAAGCLLPLTERRDLASSLGTRHRAGLGLTERTDAVVVIVSEETGWISLAHRGHLQRGLREEDLKVRLLELLRPGGGLLAAAGDHDEGPRR